MLRTLHRWLLLGCLLLCALPSSAQLNKNYFFYVGRSFIIDNKYQDAIEMLNVLLRVDDEAYEAYFLRGVAKYNLDDLIGAKMDFTKAIEINPVYTLAYHYRAITQARLGDYDDALQDYREAIYLRPDRPDPYYSRGVTFMLNHQPEEAIADFTRYLRFDGKSADAHLARGECLLMSRDTTAAIEDFHNAIRINRDNPKGYERLGVIHFIQEQKEEALERFNMAIACDSTYLSARFNRAMLYSNSDRPMEAIDDFTAVLRMDPTNSTTYFNRAILRSQIGDYNNALLDYDQVENYSPNNVLLYYNRAGLQTRLGNIDEAIEDYSRAIELYPDFANAYLGRSSLRYLLGDTKRAKSDKQVAEKKIAQYRSKLTKDEFSSYADTSQHFNKLLSFDNKMSTASESGVGHTEQSIELLPLFRFTLVKPEESTRYRPTTYYVEQVDQMNKMLNEPNLQLSNLACDLSPDELMAMDKLLADSLRVGHNSWQLLFKRGVTQSLIHQYTSSINAYTEAIDRAPSNPFLYLNRSATQSDMIDFISSISNNYQRITVSNDPANQLHNNSTRTYDYDKAIADLNKAAKLLPNLAHIYYNRAGLLCRSSMLPEAIEEYTRAIELDPTFGEAYYNRGLIQIYLKDTQKGCLDMSKAGELGIEQAYALLKRYINIEHD